ncbi:hypothetical protein KNN17_11920 [Arthrobacter bambusae]|jgi:hypothetical protein|uniref:hypothetical protein n=1 Tax=Arthrobacter TaxID=1663 RepID=UPI001F511B1C|nr:MULTISPECIES: hypothetical protein [Arthrobacter]MCI0142284.1 hypothetical protein [Arthrobacter bambusae]UYY80964.1 hypothetical protein OIT41_16920 [Arthrobacter sp. YA7-1]
MAFHPSIWRRAAFLVLGAGILAVTACSSGRSVSNADVPAWKATTMPSVAGVVLEDSGKIPNRDPLVKNFASVAAGSYILTVACDGGGKAFFDVSSGGTRITEAGAACFGSRETSRIKIPSTGPVSISASSVDAPVIYAYQLVPAS